ncbi:MAG: hypothetical protein JO336_07905 [Acidobacteriia bacterium]|nr:hypothetical protein [Terriglobia bacterium]MBV8904292.1 hypothetical protein [Terriglobia bacterium]
MMRSITAVLILSSTASFAATVQLSGIRDLNDTAVVSNVSLSGSAYSFAIENTAPVGIIANVGLSFGNTLRLSSFTTSAPFQYNIQNNTVAPDFNFTLDFALAGADQTNGLMPGESETFTWILTMADGAPVSGISAMDIAEHQVVRFRLLPTATGTDLALGPSAAVPEPATRAITGVALLVMVMTAWRQLKKRIRADSSCRPTTCLS